MKRLIFVTLSTVLAASTWAKIPAPVLSDEAKAKAAEAAAKTAHNGKVDGYKLCMSMEKTAAHFLKTAQSSGKAVKPAIATPPCADPGAFVYTPPAAVAAPAGAAAPVVATAPTASVAVATPAAAAAAAKKP